MKTVLAAGSFSILHPGHVYFLEQAKQCGDRLVVVVAHDTTVRKRLGYVLVPQEDRRRVIAALRCVDEAVNGNPGDIFSILKDIRPDVIALGYDQTIKEQILRKRIEEYGLQTTLTRIPQLPGYSSTRIRKKCKKEKEVV